MGSWTREEIEITVADYLDMLEAEQVGEEYKKSKHRRLLSSLLDDRTESAIEWKHQNISAVLIKHGFPHIVGYKPKVNFQGLLEEIVLEEIGRRNIHRTSAEQSKYPFHAFSWEVISPYIAIKAMDKSSFLHHGTGVPKEVAFFFGYKHSSEPKEITLVHDDIQFPATLTPDIVNQRIRLFWRGNFSKIIAQKLPQYYVKYSEGVEPAGSHPEMRFIKDTGKGEDVYSVEFIDTDLLVFDGYYSDEGHVEDAGGHLEGAAKRVLSTVYEREPKNRLAAIRVHGYKCIACGFDFCAAYGEWGRYYIEIHHVIPLSEKNEEYIPDPNNDLVPVCANCHRMIHRERNKALEISELQVMIKSFGQRKEL